MITQKITTHRMLLQELKQETSHKVFLSFPSFGSREGSYIEGGERKSLCPNKGRRKEVSYSVTLEGIKELTVF